ncbi:unnamed protein product [Caenorhabditis angaria]|uniref:Ig-like domain-containing protein n=1 Tax=Caenorhabditis angaria TaxID=860376 RepID=A0A9P1I788_9PELO|nr:unnamed protein product [Caenorhabditis angaria]
MIFQQLLSFSLFLAFFQEIIIQADQSCNLPCQNDAFPPSRCGIWLKNETRLSSLGTYELSKGLTKLYCSFSSLPGPAQIQWMFRANSGPTGGLGQWEEFPCAKKEENKVCGDSEILVESYCEVRTTRLTMSGAYKCSATIPTDPNRHRAVSSEFPINVVGIQAPTVISSHLPLHKNGEIEIEICANPKPEIIWHTSEGLLYEKQSTLTIKGELTSLHEKISVRVKTSSSNFTILSILLIFISLY